MQLSLLESLPSEEVQTALGGNQEQQQPPVTTTETIIETADEKPPVETPTETQEPDLNALIAKKTGDKWKTVDELLAAADKPVNQDINFANELSKQVFDFLKEGKVDDFISVYSEQKMLREVSSMETADVLKLKIKYENPELSAAEIEEEFTERYGVEPLDIDEELDDAADVAKAKKAYEKQLKNAEREMKKDLKEAKEFLSQKAQEIVLPNIEQKQSPAEVPDNGADEVLIKQEREKYVKSIEPAMKELGDFVSTYKDDDVEITTKVSIEDADKTALKTELDDFFIVDYYGKRYLKEDGTFDTTTIARDLYKLNNMDKIINAHVAQAVQQTKSQLIKGIKNAQFDEPVDNGRGDEQKKQEAQMVDYFFSRT